MKDYDAVTNSSYFKFWDVNTLSGWAMLQKLPVDNFQCRNDKLSFCKNFIRNHDEVSDKGYILMVDIKHQKELHRLHGEVLFLHDRMKIDKFGKLVCNLFDKKNSVINMKALKQVLNHGLILERVHGII